MLIEVCVESLEEAIRAEERGANRIELCSDLSQDGLTPSFELIAAAKHQLNIPFRVMIRPRGGDFVYSEAEMDEMYQAIDYCKKQMVNGVVFGVLKAGNELDLDRIKELAKRAFPLKVTIHKAIDLTPDPLASVASLHTIPGIHSVLTSGGAPTAIEGAKILQKMIALTDNLEIMAAGKVTNQNLDDIHHILNSRAYHGRRIVGDISDSSHALS